jgi:hypothetical protein
MAMRVTDQTIANFIEKASRLYEQERRAASAALRLRYTSGRFGWVEGVVETTVGVGGAPKGIGRSSAHLWIIEVSDPKQHVFYRDVITVPWAISISISGSVCWRSAIK